MSKRELKSLIIYDGVRSGENEWQFTHEHFVITTMLDELNKRKRYWKTSCDFCGHEDLHRNFNYEAATRFHFCKAHFKETPWLRNKLNNGYRCNEE